MNNDPKRGYVIHILAHNKSSLSGMCIKHPGKQNLHIYDIHIYWNHTVSEFANLVPETTIKCEQRDWIDTWNGLDIKQNWKIDAVDLIWLRALPYPPWWSTYQCDVFILPYIHIYVIVIIIVFVAVDVIVIAFVYIFLFHFFLFCFYCIYIYVHKCVAYLVMNEYIRKSEYQERD